MKSHTLVKISGGLLGLSAIVLVGMLKAQDYGEKEEEVHPASRRRRSSPSHALARLSGYVRP